MESHDPQEQEKLRPFLEDFRNASVEEMERLLQASKKKAQMPLSKKERKRLKKIYREEMVKRSHLTRIIAAWIITVPASAIMAAIMFFTIRGLLV
jgi:PiT family inorganic phosphate transporter